MNPKTIATALRTQQPEMHDAYIDVDGLEVYGALMVLDYDDNEKLLVFVNAFNEEYVKDIASLMSSSFEQQHS